MSDAFEAWQEFTRGERVDRRQPVCCGCGGKASGDIVMDEKGEDGRPQYVCGKCDAEWTGDAAIVAAALAAGWKYEQVSLYDEEGVEGFEWTAPDGKTCTSLSRDGGWSSGPEVPDEVRLLFDERYAAQRKARREEVGKFASFLDGLVNDRPTRGEA